jgi:hypothetical protein
MIYDPHVWYWRADDGRVFSGERQLIVGEDDAGYLAFKEGQMPTQWPRDDAGEQTDAALQEVLQIHSIFVTLEGYAANERWKMETGGITSTTGVPLETNDRSKGMIIGVAVAAMAKAVTSPAGSGGEYMTTWVGADRNLYPLTRDQVVDQAVDLQLHIDACFAAYADIATQVRAKKITTHAQIDERFAAIKKR